MFDFTDALQHVIATDGSDLHVKVGSRPIVRTHGRLAPIPGSDSLSPADTEGALHAMLQDEAKLDEFAREHEVDFAYSLPGSRAFASTRSVSGARSPWSAGRSSADQGVTDAPRSVRVAPWRRT